MEQKSVFQPGDYSKLVKALKRHDLEGFSNFYDSCSLLFFGYIKKALYNQNASEDTLQKSFCSIWHSVDQFDPTKQGLFAWSFKIVGKEVSKKKVDLILSEIFACQRLGSDEVTCLNNNTK